MANLATLPVPSIPQNTFTAERRRVRVRETVIGLLFVAPATLITLIFGLYPVVYGFFISLQGGKAVPTGFVGLKNYLTALGGVAYLLALALAWVLIWFAWRFWRQAYTTMQSGEAGNFYLYFIPAVLAAPATLALAAMVFLGLDSGWYIFPAALIILASVIYVGLYRAQAGRGGTQYILNSWGVVLFTLSGVILVLFTFQQLDANTAATFGVLRPLLDDVGVYLPPLAPQFLIVAGTVAAFALGILLTRLRVAALHGEERSRRATIFGILRGFALLLGILLTVLLIAGADQLRTAAAGIGTIDPDTLTSAISATPDLVARNADAGLLTFDVLAWPQIFALLLGIALIGGAYLIWQNAARRQTTPGVLSMLCLSISLMVGGWLLIGELPNAVANGDTAYYQSLLRTATYAAVTVPLQLGLGLLLAYLLFHVVTVGKGLFRMIFFIPYIAPTVATAAVFAVIFSLRSESPANQFMQAIGLPPQQWLRNPNGIFEVLAGIISNKLNIPTVHLPPFLVGPSLPLTTAIIFCTWVFSGYDAVIFMAGLGGVPRELYEAAEVDGANRWANFRYITLPMISPTTFFLTILTIIGTFQAFVHIYVLRAPDSRGAMDVATVKIFDAIRNGLLPYASAMSFVLFGIILILTLVQNRVARDQVFYG